MTNVLSISDLHIEYRVGGRVNKAVEGINLEIAAGQTVALVGESGSGKSTIAQAVIGNLHDAATITAGTIHVAGKDVSSLSQRRLAELRGRTIGYIPQDPIVNLNPLHKVWRQVAEPLRVLRLASKKEARERAIELLDRVGLPEPRTRAEQYPHELSGGMRQRVLIAAALAAEPRLLVADEPTTALDVTVQKRILDDIEDLSAREGIAVLLITHDLGVAADRADKIVVLRSGQIVEQGDAATVLTQPRDPYTKLLLDSFPGRRASFRPQVADRDQRDVHVQVRELKKSFPVPHPQEKGRLLPAVDGVEFDLAAGETLAVVGESGSGKTTTARLVLGLEKATSGHIDVVGRDVVSLDPRQIRQFRAIAQLVYQNPYASLNPRLSVKDIITEPLRGFKTIPKSDIDGRFADLMNQVRLDISLQDRLPAELSGGQRQRVAIARALAPEPQLVVLDEPVSALDVSVQSEILELLIELQDRLGVSYLFITHDLGVVREIAHRVAVMQRGQVVEIGTTEQVFRAPSHPQTRELLAAIPGLETIAEAIG